MTWQRHDITTTGRCSGVRSLQHSICFECSQRAFYWSHLNTFVQQCGVVSGKITSTDFDDDIAQTSWQLVDVVEWPSLQEWGYYNSFATCIKCSERMLYWSHPKTFVQTLWITVDSWWKYNDQQCDVVALKFLSIDFVDDIMLTVWFCGMQNPIHRLWWWHHKDWYHDVWLKL